MAFRNRMSSVWHKPGPSDLVSLQDRLKKAMIYFCWSMIWSTVHLVSTVVRMGSILSTAKIDHNWPCQELHFAWIREHVRSVRSTPHSTCSYNPPGPGVSQCQPFLLLLLYRLLSWQWQRNSAERVFGGDIKMVCFSTLPSIDRDICFSVDARDLDLVYYWWKFWLLLLTSKRSQFTVRVALFEDNQIPFNFLCSFNGACLLSLME